MRGRAPGWTGAGGSGQIRGMAGAWSRDGSAGERPGADSFPRWLGAGLVLHALLVLGGGRLSLGAGMASLVHQMRQDQRSFFLASIEIPVEPPAHPAAPPAAEEPPAPPEPPPEVRRAPPPPKEEPPPEEPSRARNLFAKAADAVAQAAKVLTRDDPADGVAVASGNAEGPTYGLVAGAGTGTVPTFDPHAVIGGRPGGKGQGLGSGPPPGPDRSRGAHVYGGFTEDCEFPAEADTAGIDHAAAMVVVTVRADGAPEEVEVVDDPGHGFGRAARICALKLRYLPARDRDGTLLRAKTPPVTIRFTR